MIKILGGLIRLALFVIVFALLKLISTKDELDEKTEAREETGSTLSYSMIQKRENVRKMMKVLMPIAKIEEWKFDGNNEKDILMKLEDRNYFIKGRISYETGSFPRITQIKYKGGIVEGIAKPDFTTEQFVANFEKELQTPEKLGYLNEKMSNLLLGEETTQFSILDYENITEDEFKGTFSETKLNAFIQMLKKHFAVLSVDGWRLVISEKEID